MSDYLKAAFKATFSENSDYSDPEWITNWDDFELTPDEAETYKVEAITSGGTTVDTSKYSTVTLVAVKNLDSTNYVTATFRTAGNSTTNNIIQIPAGGLLVVSDFTAANSLVLAADTAACICKVTVCGT